MKKTLRILSLILIISMLSALLGCDSATGSMMGGGYGGGFESAPSGGLKEDGDSSSDDATLEDGEEDEKHEETPKEEKPIYLPAGMITAGAWNDNDYYSMWQNLFYQMDAEDGTTTQGKFFYYGAKNNWGFNSLKRVKVNVVCDGNPVAGATVVANDNNGNTLFSAVSDAQGNAYLFVTEDDGLVSVTSGEGSAYASFDAENRELLVELSAKGEKLNVIEIMFLVDVTGSMGDEINFLKAELADVINKIAENDSETLIKLAFLFYRDLDDKVPFYYCDFMDVTDSIGMELRQNELNAQYASGGGDYEEAVDEALMKAVEAQWSTGATTKLIFHVLDAPAHSGSKYETKFNEAVVKAAQQGIRICPILCSGAAEVTEYTMRQAAIYTGGTFIFVTDDSGIGGSHYDPNLPNVTVELLNTMLVRLVKGYHTGEFDNPIYWKEDPALATKQQ